MAVGQSFSTEPSGFRYSSRMRAAMCARRSSALRASSTSPKCREKKANFSSMEMVQAEEVRRMAGLLLRMGAHQSPSPYSTSPCTSICREKAR